MKQVVWGYVTRDIRGEKQILIATRFKKDDPLRKGELVLPGGGLEEGEDYIQAAIREVYQETGIETEFSVKSHIKPWQATYRKTNLFGHVDENGLINLTYLDSGKEYQGRLIALSPLNSNQEPVEQENSDARNPRYISLEEAFKRQKKFTPACQVLLDTIRKVDTGFDL